jgi:hypothetical protein
MVGQGVDGSTLVGDGVMIFARVAGPVGGGAANHLPPRPASAGSLSVRLGPGAAAAPAALAITAFATVAMSAGPQL